LPALTLLSPARPKAHRRESAQLLRQLWPQRGENGRICGGGYCGACHRARCRQRLAL